MIEKDLAIRMFSSRNNFTGTLVGFLKKNHIFDFVKNDGTEFILYKHKLYQFSTGEGDYAEVRQGVNHKEIGLIFYSTSHSPLYKYEGYELEVDDRHNKINTSGVKLYTKKALLEVNNIMQFSLGFDKDVYIQECYKYTRDTIKKMEKIH